MITVIWEDPTCHTTTIEPVLWAPESQFMSPRARAAPECPKLVLRNKRSH